MTVDHALSSWEDWYVERHLPLKLCTVFLFPSIFLGKWSTSAPEPGDPHPKVCPLNHCLVKMVTFLYNLQSVFR